MLADLIARDAPDADTQIRQARTLSNLTGLMPTSLALGDIEELKLNILDLEDGLLPLLRDESQTRHPSFRRYAHLRHDRNRSQRSGRSSIAGRSTIRWSPAHKSRSRQNIICGRHSTNFSPASQLPIRRQPPQGCLITFDKIPGRDATFRTAKTIAPLIERKCAGCHSAGNVGPFELDGYDDVKHWSAMMQEVVLDRRMPPWDADPHFGHFSNDRSLPPAESRLLLKWIDDDCPRGDGDDPLAAPRPAVAKWALGRARFRRPAAEPAGNSGDRRARLSLSRLRIRHASRCLAAGRGLPPRQSRRWCITSSFAFAIRKTRRKLPASHIFSRPGRPACRRPSARRTPACSCPKGAQFNFEMHYTTNGESADRPERNGPLSGERAAEDET